MAKLNRALGWRGRDQGPPREATVPKIIIGYPVGGSVTLPFHVSMLRLVGYELQKPKGRRLLSAVEHTQGLYVAENRNVLAQQFVAKAGATWLLQIDTDIEFPEDLLERMLAIAGTERKIIAANVPLGHYATVAFNRHATLPGVWDNFEQMPGDLVEVDAVATAVVLIHREVFETIAARHGQCWFNHLYLPCSPEGTSRAESKFRQIGEDISFCLRAQEAGFSIYAARVSGLRHHKTKPLSEDFEQSAAAVLDHDNATGELVAEI
jgi:hypothetical protein